MMQLRLKSEQLHRMLLLMLMLQLSPSFCLFQL
jgi:hypothetical protein